MLGSDEAGDGAAGEPTVPAAMADSWRSAEAQLFGAVLNVPELYRGVVSLVGDTVGRLRRLGPSTAALLDVAPGIGSMVRAGLDDHLPAGRIDPDLVGRAALAVRHREVIAEQASARRVGRLAAARADQLSWIVLEESGDWAGDLFAPYRRMEAEAASGHALLVTAAPDDEFRTVQHAVEVLQVDVETGRVAEPPDADVAPFRCRTAAEREAHAATLRTRLTRRE